MEKFTVRQSVASAMLSLAFLAPHAALATADPPDVPTLPAGFDDADLGPVDSAFTLPDFAGSYLTLGDAITSSPENLNVQSLASAAPGEINTITIPGIPRIACGAKIPSIHSEGENADFRWVVTNWQGKGYGDTEWRNLSETKDKARTGEYRIPIGIVLKEGKQFATSGYRVTFLDKYGNDITDEQFRNHLLYEEGFYWAYTAPETCLPITMSGPDTQVSELGVKLPTNLVSPVMIFGPAILDDVILSVTGQPPGITCGITDLAGVKCNGTPTQPGAYNVVFAANYDGFSAVKRLTWVIGCNTGFPDVPMESQFSCDVKWLADNSITNGYADGTFRPGISVSREASAAFLHRFNGGYATELPADHTFHDVVHSIPGVVPHTFHREIEWMAATGISNGYTDPGQIKKGFHPGSPVTRESMAAFIYRVYGSPDYTPPATPTFWDVPKTNTFYKEIEWMVSLNITTGYSDGGFHPSATVTRQSAAAFLRRASENVPL